MKNLLGSLLQPFLTKSFFIFLGIGLLCASIDYVVYLQLLSRDLPMLVAKISSSVLAVLFNYLLNSRFNFGGSHKTSLKRMALYGTLYAVLIVIHALFNQGFYFVLNNIHLAVLGALGVSVVVNYLIVKKFFKYYQTQRSPETTTTLPL